MIGNAPSLASCIASTISTTRIGTSLSSISVGTIAKLVILPLLLFIIVVVVVIIVTIAVIVIIIPHYHEQHGRSGEGTSLSMLDVDNADQHAQPADGGPFLPDAGSQENRNTYQMCILSTEGSNDMDCTL